MDRPQWVRPQADGLGLLRNVQRDGANMTDPITCPECGGRRGQQLGALFLACPFCHGRGWVGGEHEPAEPPPPPSHRPPAWAHRSLAGTGICGHCLGAGRVLLLGGGETPRVAGRTAPCPSCQ